MSGRRRATRRRRRTVLQLVLASVALLGIGAAATSAAWTDDVFFGSTATASSFDLQGRGSTSGAWLDIAGVDETADADGSRIVIDTSGVLLQPGVAADYVFQIQNVGSVGGDLVWASLELTGVIFGGDAPATATLVAPPGTIAAGSGPVSVTLRISPPAGWNSSTTNYQGATGQVVIQVTGTSTS